MTKHAVLHGALLAGFITLAGGAAAEPVAVAARPDASNTGVPNGTVLTAYTGPAQNNASNTTFQNLDFPVPGGLGYYIFRGNGITLRNCYIRGGIQFEGDNITIENCTIEGGASLSGTNGVRFRHNQIKKFAGDALHITADSGVTANVLIENSYFHTPTPECGDHADGVQVRGVTKLTVVNNTIDMGPWFQVCGNDVLNAAIFLESANGGNRDMTIDGNYLDGAGITLRLTAGANQRVINNRFGRKYHYRTVWNQSRPGDITERAGNVMDDDNSPVNF